MSCDVATPTLTISLWSVLLTPVSLPLVIGYLVLIVLFCVVVVVCLPLLINQSMYFIITFVYLSIISIFTQIH